MGQEFIHSVLAQNETVTAGTVITYDLPVNPLSHLFLTLKFAQNQADVQLDWDIVDAMITKVEVLYKSSPIFSMSGSDIEAYQCMLFGYEPWINNRMGNDNDVNWFTFLVPLTRDLFSPRECFPRSTRGELQLQITYAAALGAVDAVFMQIESVELPEANPDRYLRTTTLSVTPSAVGELDIEIPIGNDISHIMFFGTTVPLADVGTVTLTYCQLLVDNMRRYFSQTNFQTWRQQAALRHKPPIAHGYHDHQLNGAVYAQYMDTAVVKYRNDRCTQHLWLEFDPRKDDNYLLKTAGKSDVVVRIYAGDTNALRVLPGEVIQV